MIDREFWTLLVISAAGARGLTPAQLQKSLFLLGKAYPSQINNFYNFIPYNYGPFDEEIYHDADKLIKDKLVKKVLYGNRGWSKYYITSLGKTTASIISRQLPADIINYLQRLVSWIQSLSFEELITSVYKEYPEYKVNSVFRGVK